MKVLVAAALVVALLVGGCAGCRSLAREQTFTVTRLDDQPTRHGHQYLVFTDHGVFKDTDTLVFFKFDSSDLFAKLRVGHRYRCKTYGVRIPLFSGYPNLINCAETGG